MKKSTFTLWSLIILFVVNVQQISAQEYYWSDNRKIPLVKDETAMLVEADEGSSVEINLRRGNSFQSIERINEKAVLVRMKTSKEAMLDELATISSNMITSFKSSSGEEMIPTGELLLMPKKGVGIEALEKLIGQRLTVSENKYGTYVRLQTN